MKNIWTGSTDETLEGALARVWPERQCWEIRLSEWWRGVFKAGTAANSSNADVDVSVESFENPNDTLRLTMF